MPLSAKNLHLQTHNVRDTGKLTKIIKVINFLQITNMHFYLLGCPLLVLLGSFASGDYLCKESEDMPIKNCENHLICEYAESFKEKKGKRRFCRCRTEFKYLPNNNFTIHILNSTCFKNFKDLQQLYLKDTGLTRIDNNIFKQYSNLKELNLAGNNIELDFSTDIKSLIELDISFNNLVTLPPASLKGLKSVKVFKASFNKINDITLSFNQLTLIEELYLNNNHLRKIGIDDFTGLFKLRILNLAFNFLTVIESSMVLVELHELYLNNNNLSSLNSAEDVTLPNLRILNINFNNFTMMRNKHNFKFLEELHGSSNKFEFLNETANLLDANIKLLNMSGNRIKTIQENHLKYTESLKKLDVSLNKLETMEKNYLNRLTQVQHMDLLFNEDLLSCKNFQNMEQLLVLDLSFNSILKLYNCTFEKLNRLKDLNLKRNQIKSLPQGVFDGLNSLENLDLAENRIDVLPNKIFSKTIKLRSLNILHNNIPNIESNQVAQLDSIDFGYNSIQCDKVAKISNLLQADMTIVFPCNELSQCCLKKIDGFNNNQQSTEISPTRAVIIIWMLIALAVLTTVQVFIYMIFKFTRKDIPNIIALREI